MEVIYFQNFLWRVVLLGTSISYSERMHKILIDWVSYDTKKKLNKWITLFKNTVIKNVIFKFLFHNSYV